MSEKILEALYKLDPENDSHWTMNGEAKLDTVKFKSGGISVTREELEKIAPGYNREALKKYLASQIKTEPTNAEAKDPENTGDGAGATVEPSEPENPVIDRKDEIEALAAEIASTDEAIIEVKRVQREAGEELERLEARSNELRDKMNVVNPPPTHQENIKAYLASVRRTNMKRAAARYELANSGVDIDGLQRLAAPSPIDQSLAGRRR